MMEIGFAPTFKLIGPKAAPEVAAEPLIVIVEVLGADSVAVTVVLVVVFGTLIMA